MKRISGFAFLLCAFLLLSLCTKPCSAQSPYYCVYEHTNAHSPFDEVASRNDFFTIFPCGSEAARISSWAPFPQFENWGLPIPPNMNLEQAEALADYIMVTDYMGFGAGCCKAYPIYAKGFPSSPSLAVTHETVMPGYFLYDGGGRCCETQVNRAFNESVTPPLLPGNAGDCRQFHLYNGTPVAGDGPNVCSLAGPITLSPGWGYPPINLAACANTGATTTTPPATGNIPVNYLGCFVDNHGDGDRALQGFRGDPPFGNSVQKCASICSSKGFSLMGVEYGVNCFCSNRGDFGRFGASNQCTMACPGNQGEACGGYLAVGVYQIARPTPATSTLPNRYQGGQQNTQPRPNPEGTTIRDAGGGIEFTFPNAQPQH